MTLTIARTWDPVIFGDPQLRTDGELVALAFGEDGTLWSVDDPGILRQWHAGTGRELSWQSLSDFETLWCFSRDARLLASAGTDDLSVWETATGDLRVVLRQPAEATALAFAPEARLLASGHEDGIVRLWELGRQRRVREFRGHDQPISALAFSADGRQLATACEAKRITLWDVELGQERGTLEGHTDRIPALLWHPDGRTLISAGWDTTARLWDTRTAQPIILLNSHAQQVAAMALAPDGTLLACADSDRAIHLWDLPQGSLRTILKGPADDVRCLAFSGDGERLASAGADRVVHLWDPLHGQAISNHAPRTASRTALTLSVDGVRLATNGGAAVRMLSTATRQPVLQLGDEAEVVHALAFSPDGRWLAGGSDEHIRLWDAGTGQPQRLLEGPDEPCTALAFAPNSATLASAGSLGTAVWLWQVKDGEPSLLIPDALDGCTIESLAFHPKGRLLAVGGIDWLATGGSDGAICLWDLHERCEVAMFVAGTTALAFHPSGRRVVSTTLARTIAIWEVETQQLVEELAGHDDTVTCVAYSPDGRRIASGSDDRTVRLWDSQTGAELCVCPLDTQIKSLCFSCDGRYLYTGNGNTTCYQLDVRQLLEM